MKSLRQDLDFRTRIESYRRELETNKGNSAVGSPDYMAVEILRGSQYNFSVDWWSIGTRATVAIARAQLTDACRRHSVRNARGAAAVLRGIANGYLQARSGSIALVCARCLTPARASVTSSTIRARCAFQS